MEMRQSLMTFSMVPAAVRKELDADALVRIANENQIAEIDIMQFEINLYGEEAVKEALLKYHVDCGCVIATLSFFDRKKTELEEDIRNALCLTQRMGAHMLMIVPGKYDEQEKQVLAKMTRDKIMEEAVEGFRIAVEMAKEYNIMVVFENTPHAMKPLAAADDCEELLKQVPGLGFVFDTGNYRIAQSDCDELKIYGQLKKYMVRCHLKDVVVGNFETGEECTDGKRIRCVPSGSGIIPIKELIHRMSEDGYTGSVAIEFMAPEQLKATEYTTMVHVYAGYIRSCIEGEPMCPKYAELEGVSKPVSRLFFGTANVPMLMGKNVDYLLDAAMSYGINAFDCARGYGLAEKSLGQWIKDRNNRERVVILSKCGNVDGQGNVCVNRDVINKELEESLATLQTDYIDIYLLHRDDPNTSVEEIIDALNKAKDSGKIKIFGVSNWTHERIKEANAYAKSQGLQGFCMSSPNFGLAEQIADPWGGDCVTITGKTNKEAREWYRNNQMPLLAYSSLARGLMSGKIRSSQEQQANELLDPFAIKGYVYHENFLRLARCEELAQRKKCTVSQIAIGWMYTQGLNLFSAASTTNITRLEENVMAMHMELSQQEAQYLNLESEEI